MKTILVIGGTTEARRAAACLEEAGFHVVISVATGLGELYTRGHVVITGSKNETALAVQAARLEALAIVDCTHPFATAASHASRGAAAAAGIPYLRFTRAGGIEDGVAIADSWEQAVALVKERRERALLTIGVRQLEAFAAAGVEFAARVLPMPESIAECLRVGLRPEDIIAAFPPHSVDFNRACIRKVAATMLVMKDSGSEGGTPEKIEAAAAEGIQSLMVRRPQEEDVIVDLAELVVRVQEVAGA